MKARATHLLAIFASTVAQSQIAFDLPDALPGTGTAVQYEWGMSDPPTSFATSGINVTWDFTGLFNAGNMRTTSESTPEGTPGAAEFPNATHAHRETQGEITVWTYYRLDVNDSLWFEGAHYSDGMLYACASPDLYMRFPYAIGDLVESNIICSNDGGPPMPNNQGFMPMATGTMLYPDGSITDAVLVEEYQNGEPGTYYWFRGDNVLEWIAILVPGSLLGLWADAPNMVGEDARGQPLSVYPVPANDAVIVEVPPMSGPVMISVLDDTGRTLSNDALIAVDGRLTIDVTAWPAGQYALRMVQALSIRGARISVCH